MSPHPHDCGCDDCEAALVRLFGASSPARDEDVRWAAGMIRLRRELGLSQRQLAERAGFPQKSLLCEIESGRRPISMRTLRRLGRVLGGVDTLLVIRRLESRPDDDSDLIDEDPVSFTDEQVEGAMRDLADSELVWKGLAARRRHQLESLAEMLHGGDVDGARRYLADLLAPTDTVPLIAEEVRHDGL
jgi:transcriptional regulator with XRE-family HTH domain